MRKARLGAGRGVAAGVGDEADRPVAAVGEEAAPAGGGGNRRRHASLILFIQLNFKLRTGPV